MFQAIVAFILTFLVFLGVISSGPEFVYDEGRMYPDKCYEEVIPEECYGMPGEVKRRITVKE